MAMPHRPLRAEHAIDDCTTIMDERCEAVCAADETLFHVAAGGINQEAEDTTELDEDLDEEVEEEDEDEDSDEEDVVVDDDMDEDNPR